MYRIKLGRPCRGMILAVIGVIVLAGAAGFAIIEARAVSALVSEAKADSASLGEQIRDNAVIFGVYKNASTRVGRSRKLAGQAESAQRKLWILRGERKELVNIAEQMSAVERLLVRKDIEGALNFCDEQTTEYQNELDDLFRRLSVTRPKFAGLRNRRNARNPFQRSGVRRRSMLSGAARS